MTVSVPMSFLRRGSVPHPYIGPKQFLLTKLSGEPLLVSVGNISCFEEHSMPRCLRHFTTVYFLVGSQAVQETFDEIAAILAGQEADYVQG